MAADTNGGRDTMTAEEFGRIIGRGNLNEWPGMPGVYQCLNDCGNIFIPMLDGGSTVYADLFMPPPGREAASCAECAPYMDFDNNTFDVGDVL